MTPRELIQSKIEQWDLNQFKRWDDATDAVIRDLWEDKRKLRERIADLEAQISELTNPMKHEATE